MAPKKKEQQKMSLGDFLGDQSLGSWADEMEDMPVSSHGGAGGGYGMERRAFSSNAGGFGGDRGGFGERSDRYPPREQLPLPTRPPFTAHLGNLSFDATEGDIQDFFADCAVTNVRIIEDKLDRKPKGFAYVEYGTLDGLKNALDRNGTQFQGRNLRVTVAEPPKDREREDRGPLDWTRKAGPLPDLPGQQRSTSGRGGFRRDFDDAGSESGGSRRRTPFNEGDGKSRDFGNWERKGPLSPVPRDGPPREGGRVRDGPRERKNSPSWGEGRPQGEGGSRSQEGSRPPRREFQERPVVERQPTAADLDNQWRARMKPDAPPPKSPIATPESSTPASPAQPPAQAQAPGGRPRLNLAKRTVSTAEGALTPGAESKSSIFGGAKPIDTAAREAEVEERRQLAIRQKKEADDKKREEEKQRKASEATAKAERPKTDRAGSVSKDNSKVPAKDDSKENGGETPVRANFEILRRAEAGSEVADADAEEGDTNGTIADDKQVLPQEKVVEPKKQEQSWRKAPGAAAEAGSTAEKLQDDGWSTVTSSRDKSRSKRGNQNAGRAIAS